MHSLLAGLLVARGTGGRADGRATPVCTHTVTGQRNTDYLGLGRMALPVVCRPHRVLDCPCGCSHGRAILFSVLCGRSTGPRPLADAPKIRLLGHGTRGRERGDEVDGDPSLFFSFFFFLFFSFQRFKFARFKTFFFVSNFGCMFLKWLYGLVVSTPRMCASVCWRSCC